MGIVESRDKDFITVAENDKERAVAMLNSQGHGSTEHPDCFL